MRRLVLLLTACAAATVSAQTPTQPDWAKIDQETLQHFQALVRIDTTDPPGGEKPAVDYLRKVLEAEGIPTETFALEPNRPNLVARLKGTGKKKPLLIMGHTDTVNVDAKKWTQPPFSAAREGGHIYGRGTVDDKDNVAAALMVMLTLKRLNVPLDRDVIFLAEAGEEGTVRVGIKYMTDEHYPGDRGGVLPRRGRQRHPPGRAGEVRVRADPREDPSRHRAHRARAGRARLGPAEAERRRPPVVGGGEGGPVEAADAAQRDHPRLLRAPRLDLPAGGGGALPGHHRQRSEGRGRGRRLAAGATSRATRR